MANPKKKVRNFRALLVRSHMTVTLFGCVIVLAGILSTVYLVRQTGTLTRTIAPIQISSSTILVEISRSIASLRGWVNLGEGRFLMDWENAWDEGIDPAFKAISMHTEFLAHSKLDSTLSEIKSLLVELEESQWWVLETANTPGNEPAKVIYLLEIDPIIEEISLLVGSLSPHIISDNVSVKYKRLERLHGLMDNFVLLRLYLDKIIFAGNLSLENDFHEQFHLTKNAQIALFKTLPKTGLLMDLKTALSRELTALGRYANEAIDIRKTEEWNVARFLMKTETLPLANQVLMLASRFADRTQSAMSAASASAAKTGNVVIYGLVAMLVVMVMGTYAVARNRARALAAPVSQLEKATREFAGSARPERVAITGPTEIESLANSFNVMCRDLETAQSQLLRQEKLAAIGQLSGSVAHDIRNPLGVISNSIYFLNRISGPGTDKKFMKHINIMTREIDRSKEIINDLMDFSRDHPPVLEKGDINSVLGEVLSRVPQRENITVETALDSDLPRVFFDASQIRRAFLNLINNALQAIPHKGTVLVTSRPLDGFVEIVFKDTGSGIPKAHLEEIFEPLFTTKAKGVGLGLSIVREFIRKHNGTIDVKSEVGKGTAFTIKLPINIQEGREDD